MKKILSLVLVFVLALGCLGAHGGEDGRGHGHREDPQGKLHEADVLLREQPDCDNNPELLYLRGVCAWKRGWLDEASRLVRRAADAVPTNREYQNAVEKFCVKSKPITGSKKAESRCCSRFDFAACSAECCCECVCEGICDSIDC